MMKIKQWFGWTAILAIIFWLIKDADSSSYFPWIEILGYDHIEMSSGLSYFELIASFVVSFISLFSFIVVLLFCCFCVSASLYFFFKWSLWDE